MQVVRTFDNYTLYILITFIILSYIEYISRITNNSYFRPSIYFSNMMLIFEKKLEDIVMYSLLTSAILLYIGYISRMTNNRYLMPFIYFNKIMIMLYDLLNEALSRLFWLFIFFLLIIIPIFGIPIMIERILCEIQTSNTTLC